MPGMNQVMDRNGKPVLVGFSGAGRCYCGVLGRDLPREKWERVRSMLGEVFEVYKIDKFSGA